MARRQIMQKFISRRAIALCLFLFIMTLCMALLSAPAYSADKAIAKLTSFSGTVLIKSQGAWGVQPEKDLPLYSDDKVVTRMGIATITFDDGAVMEIKANSNLLIRETEETGIAREVVAVKRKIRLILGKMFFRSGRGTSVNTSLETTTMVCGLRGTAGILSIDAAGVTYLYFTEGEGVTIGDFISGVAPDVPPEIAELNPVQRAAIVAALAAEQAKEAAEKLARGEITEEEAALAAAKAAKAAAEEAKAAAEAMLDNPDESIREEAREVIAAAEAVIEEANEIIEAFLEGGDDDAVFGDSYGVFGDNLMKNLNSLTAQGNESDILLRSDMTPPVVELSAFPAIDGENVTANLTPIIMNIEPGNVTYTIIDANTGEPFPTTGLIDGTYSIIVIATDEAGNTSSTPFTFTLDNSYLYGNVSGTGSNITGSSEGGSSVIIGKGWGGAETTMTGTWTGTHTGSLNLTSGGSGDGVNWLSFTSGTINSGTGDASGTTDFYQISEDYISRGAGVFSGTFNSDGTWTGTETETSLVTTPFDISGLWEPFPVYENVASTYGYAGLIDTGGGEYDYIGLGSYLESSTGADTWFAEICSQDGEVSEPVAISGGVWNNGVMDGYLSGVYSSDSGSTGVFYTDVLGESYLMGNAGGDYGMWKIEGTLSPVEIYDLSDPAYAGYSVADSATEYYPLYTYNYSPSGLTLYSDIVSNAKIMTNYIYDGAGDIYASMGAWGVNLSGTYDYLMPPGDGWSLSVVDVDDQVDPSDSFGWIEIGPGYENSTWNTDNTISAYAAGAWINVADAVTGIMGGELKGTFDTTDYTWQAIAMGTMLDTETFLAMAGTAEGRAKLTELDIPCIQVGLVTLTGYGAYMYNIEMTDVQFFAYSTGAPPTIWATGDVSGNADPGMPPVGDTAWLSGSSGTADFAEVQFTMNNYGAVGGTWDATVTGYGYVGTTYLNIDGGAAGTVDSATTFSGTAAGVARQY